MTIRFAVIGINHNHIFGQVNSLLGAGATFVGFFAPEDDLAADFAPRYPQAFSLDSSARILDDPSISLVASAGINSDRARLGIEVAAVLEIGRDSRCSEAVIAELGRDAGAGRAPADHRIGVRLRQHGAGELACAVADSAEQRPLGIVAQRGTRSKGSLRG